GRTGGGRAAPDQLPFLTNERRRSSHAVRDEAATAQSTQYGCFPSPKAYTRQSSQNSNPQVRHVPAAELVSCVWQPIRCPRLSSQNPCPVAGAAGGRTAARQSPL